MSDGLPTDDQLRRIERGVQRRIDARRTAVHRVVGAVAAFALLGGGFALVLPALSGTSAASGGGSMAGPAADRAASAAPEVVRCHATSEADSASTTSDAPAGAAAETVTALCGATAVAFQSDAGRMPGAASSGQEAAGGGATAEDQDLSGQAATSAPGGAAVLCRAEDGVLHVFPADAEPETLCTRNGMTLR